MALPVIDPLDLEKFPIVLNGAPLPLVGDVTGTATAANPAGLRLSGGNTFRDYTPWAEQEIITWEAGLGHGKIGDNGAWFGELHTLFGDLRLPRNFSLDPMDIDKPTNIAWTTDDLMESGFVRGSDDVLYAFYGREIFEYDSGSGNWSTWLDTIGLMYNVADAYDTDFYIIDMCCFQNYLIVLTRPFFRKSTPVADANNVIHGTSLTGEFLYNVEVAAGPVHYAHYAPNVWAIDLETKAVLSVQYSGATPILTTTLASVQLTPAPFFQRDDVGILGTMCATVCSVHNGYLFIAGPAGFAYTSGERRSGAYNVPDSWLWEGFWADSYSSGSTTSVTHHQRIISPFNCSTFYGGSNWATGLASIQGQTISDFSVYLSTSKDLYLLDLAVPTTVPVMEYSGVSVRNGKEMMNHNNDIYVPVGGGLFRFTASGQTVPVGIDQLPENPEIGSTPANTSIMRGHIGLASSPGTLVSGVSAIDLSTGTRLSGYTMALKSQGWHMIRPIAGPMYYDPELQKIFTFWSALRSAADLDSFVVESPFVDNLSDDRIMGNTGYETGESKMHLGFFSADAPLLDKDWQSISVYGRCFDEQHWAKIDYQLLDAPVECEWFYDTDDTSWVTAGTIDSGTSAEFFIPTSHDCEPSRSSKWIALRVTLSDSLAGEGTPIVEGIKLKYFTPIADYFRFSYSVVLPAECLNDLCGVPLVGYVQEDWDQALREAACAVEPVPFRDIDGKWYLVRVESESRRIAKVAYVGPPTYREQEISWSLVLTQLMNPSICEDGWESACPP